MPSGLIAYTAFDDYSSSLCTPPSEHIVQAPDPDETSANWHPAALCSTEHFCTALHAPRLPFNPSPAFISGRSAP